MLTDNRFALGNEDARAPAERRHGDRGSAERNELDVVPRHEEVSERPGAGLYDRAVRFVVENDRDIVLGDVVIDSSCT